MKERKKDSHIREILTCVPNEARANQLKPRFKKSCLLLQYCTGMRIFLPVRILLHAGMEKDSSGLRDLDKPNRYDEARVTCRQTRPGGVPQNP
jgi:hypothetical protein